MPLMLLHHTLLTPPIGGGTSSIPQASSLCSGSYRKQTRLRHYTPSSISYFPKSDLVKLSGDSRLRFLDSFKVGGNDLKLLLKCASITRFSTHCSALVIRSDHPQNSDFPKYYSREEKKPFPVPIVELRRAARERLKKSRGKPWRPVPPPKNGLLVKKLIPLAYEVINARTLLINNLKRLVKVVTVQACKSGFYELCLRFGCKTEHPGQELLTECPNGGRGISRQGVNYSCLRSPGNLQEQKRFGNKCRYVLCPDIHGAALHRCCFKT